MALLEAVPPGRIREMWPYVRPMVEAARERIKARWLSEDVFIELIGQTALLHVARDEDGHLCGCLVSQRIVEAAESVLFVWICFHRHQDRTIADYWPEVVTLARTIGAKRIRMQGPRANDKALPVKAVATVYESEVPDGQ